MNMTSFHFPGSFRCWVHHTSELCQCRRHRLDSVSTISWNCLFFITTSGPRREEISKKVKTFIATLIWNLWSFVDVINCVVSIEFWNQPCWNVIHVSCEGITTLQFEKPRLMSCAGIIYCWCGKQQWCWYLGSH